MADTRRQRARDRVNSYQNQNCLDEGQLQDGLLAFIDHLSSNSSNSLAKEILKIKTDHSLYALFHNLLTAFVLPSKICYY